MKVDSLQSAVGHLEEERAELDGKLRAVHQEMNQLRDQKRLLEDRLNSAETALTLQVRNRRFLFVIFSYCEIFLESLEHDQILRGLSTPTGLGLN